MRAEILQKLWLMHFTMDTPQNCKWTTSKFYKYCFYFGEEKRNTNRKLSYSYLTPVRDDILDGVCIQFCGWLGVKSHYAELDYLCLFVCLLEVANSLFGLLCKDFWRLFFFYKHLHLTQQINKRKIPSAERNRDY